MKKILVTTGILALLMFAPTNNINPNTQAPAAVETVMNAINPVMEAHAASYDSNWQIDTSQTWHYKMNNGSYVTDAWVHDKTNGDWYLIDASGNMLAGIVESNEGKFYMLDNVRGTGHYGRMLKNGSIYNGITITADTSASYEGALSGESLAALTAAGVPVVGNVSGTQHVESGVVTFASTKNGASGGGIDMGMPSEDIVDSSDNSYNSSIGTHGTEPPISDDDPNFVSTGDAGIDWYLKRYGISGDDVIGGTLGYDSAGSSLHG